MKKKRPSAKLKAFVPETGFEPAHPCGRHHLKVVRLPISPPGHHPDSYREECKCKRFIFSKQF